MVQTRHGHHGDLEVQGDLPGHAGTGAPDGSTAARHALREARRRHRSPVSGTPATRMAGLAAWDDRDPWGHSDAIEQTCHMGSSQVNLLLDTHIWLWSHAEPDRLSK